MRPLIEIGNSPKINHPKFANGSSVKLAPTKMKANAKTADKNITRFVTLRPADKYCACNATVFTVALTTEDEAIEENGCSHYHNVMRKSSWYSFRCVADTPKCEGSYMTLAEASTFVKGLRLYRDVRRLLPLDEKLIFADEFQRQGIQIMIRDDGHLMFKISSGDSFDPLSVDKEFSRREWLKEHIDCTWSYGKTRAILMPLAKSLFDESGEVIGFNEVVLTPTGDVRINRYKYKIVNELIERDFE